MGLVSPNPGTIIWLVIIFGIVLFILAKFAWKPILNLLKEREESIAKALSAADKAREEVEGLKADNEKIIREARREREAILKEAKEIKDKIVAEAKEKANLETQKSIEQARIQIESEKNAAIDEIKVQVAELSVKIAEKLIQKELANTADQEKMVNGLLDNLKLN
ncbi:MAG: F0F1 ATP synthase subunit B [Prolixibacteraceae bacterium]|nr:F0F1 ATP synthase subunit B [Prolixibacteraceae bacterium]